MLMNALSKNATTCMSTPKFEKYVHVHYYGTTSILSSLQYYCHPRNMTLQLNKSFTKYPSAHSQTSPIVLSNTNVGPWLWLPRLFLSVLPSASCPGSALFFSNPWPPLSSPDYDYALASASLLQRAHAHDNQGSIISLSRDAQYVKVFP